jgi:hypothetical protein
MRPGVVSQRISGGNPLAEKFGLVGVFGGAEAVDESIDWRHVLCFQHLDDRADRLRAKFPGGQGAVGGEIVEGKGDLEGGLLGC